MVLGILSILIPYLGFFLGIIGIVLAAKALKEIRNYNQGGRGLANASLTTSIIGTSFYAILILMVVLSLAMFASM
ncbi:DUF4190 domain-containing protein [Aquibacillus kalidii]|uniref:DUF4190 domain-containing protein n=1 Tax=Aquibacillus kalidii TaxID=2762597 RepID=UPI001C98EC87|nr:DUF4190 domain-containing protein [Aquibacillus kalidii]